MVSNSEFFSFNSEFLSKQDENIDVFTNKIVALASALSDLSDNTKPLYSQFINLYKAFDNLGNRAKLFTTVAFSAVMAVKSTLQYASEGKEMAGLVSVFS